MIEQDKMGPSARVIQETPFQFEIGAPLGVFEEDARGNPFAMGFGIGDTAPVDLEGEIKGAVNLELGPGPHLLTPELKTRIEWAVASVLARYMPKFTFQVEHIDRSGNIGGHFERADQSPEEREAHTIVNSRLHDKEIRGLIEKNLPRLNNSERRELIRELRQLFDFER